MLHTRKKASQHGKSRRSDAEKRLLHEQELRKKRDDILLTFMKDKVSREARNSSLNSIKLNWQWRCILRKAKHEELHADTTYLKEKFDNLVQTKNRFINILTATLNSCNEQHDMISKTHMNELDNLIDIQNEHLNGMRSSYEKQKADVFELIQAEVKNDKKQCDSKIKHMCDLDTAFHKELFIIQTLVVSKFQNRRDELLNKSIEEQHALRMQLNVTIDSLWQQLQFLLQHYHKNVDSKRQFFEKMKTKDKQNIKEIADQDKYLEKIMVHIIHEKQKIKLFQQLGCQALQRYTVQRDELNSALISIKDQIKQASDGSNRYLTILTKENNDVTQKLNHLLCKGLQIVNLSLVCDKIEPTSKLNLHCEISASQCIKQQKFDSDDIVSASMKMFWSKINDIIMEIRVLKENDKDLCQESKELRHLLREYIDKFTGISGEKLDQLKQHRSKEGPYMCMLTKKNIMTFRNFRLTRFTGQWRVEISSNKTVEKSSLTLHQLT